MDTKRTFQIQNKRIKKIKIGMLRVLKIYFKIYSRFESDKNEIPLQSWLSDTLVTISVRALNKRSQVFLSDVSSKIVQRGSLSIS